MNATSDFPALLERFFTERLMLQQQASPHTIASYRDTFRLFLLFVQRQCLDSGEPNRRQHPVQWLMVARPSCANIAVPELDLCLIVHSGPAL